MKRWAPPLRYRIENVVNEAIKHECLSFEQINDSFFISNSFCGPVEKHHLIYPLY